MSREGGVSQRETSRTVRYEPPTGGSFPVVGKGIYVFSPASWGDMKPLQLGEGHGQGSYVLGANDHRFSRMSEPHPDRLERELLVELSH